MPRYFFHVDNGKFVPDHAGTELPDLAEARRAVRAAGAMIEEANESFWSHMSPWDMHVTDEEMRLLFTLHFSAKVPSGDVLLAPGQNGQDSGRDT